MYHLPAIVVTHDAGMTYQKAFVEQVSPDGSHTPVTLVPSANQFLHHSVAAYQALFRLTRNCLHVVVVFVATLFTRISMEAGIYKSFVLVTDGIQLPTDVVSSPLWTLLFSVIEMHSVSVTITSSELFRALRDRLEKLCCETSAAR